jgi:hypothetical protein
MPGNVVIIEQTIDLRGYCAIRHGDRDLMLTRRHVIGGRAGNAVIWSRSDARAIPESTQSGPAAGWTDRQL